MAITAIGGWMGYFLGGRLETFQVSKSAMPTAAVEFGNSSAAPLDGLMIALIIFMTLDYITGLMCAVADKKLSSAVGFRGICKKVLILMLVGVANVVDVHVVGTGSALRGADGTPIVDEAQARIVRQIYGMFLDGQTSSSIAATLTKQGVPTPTGRTNWQSSTVKSILTNEKYKGDALLQKTITVDFLSKAHKVNEGEAPQFFVENSHPAIISREVYDLVQLEIQRRGKRGRHTSAKSIFSDRLICGACGAAFGSKVWHSTDPYRKVIWRCNRKYSRKDIKCPNRHLNEEKIKDAFVTAVNQLVLRRNEIFAAYDEILAGLTDTAELEVEPQRLELEKDGVLQRITDLIHENATTKMDQGEYNRRYDALETQRIAVAEKQKRIKEKLSDKLFRKRKLEAFMNELKSAKQLIDFDEQLFIRTVEQITVFSDKLVFMFRDGTEIPVEE